MLQNTVNFSFGSGVQTRLPLNSQRSLAPAFPSTGFKGFMLCSVMLLLCSFPFLYFSLWERDQSLQLETTLTPAMNFFVQGLLGIQLVYCTNFAFCSLILMGFPKLSNSEVLFSPICAPSSFHSWLYLFSVVFCSYKLILRMIVSNKATPGTPCA